MSNNTTFEVGDLVIMTKPTKEQIKELEKENIIVKTNMYTNELRTARLIEIVDSVHYEEKYVYIGNSCYANSFFGNELLIVNASEEKKENVEYITACCVKPLKGDTIYTDVYHREIKVPLILLKKINKIIDIRKIKNDDALRFLFRDQGSLWINDKINKESFISDMEAKDKLTYLSIIKEYRSNLLMNITNDEKAIAELLVKYIKRHKLTSKQLLFGRLTPKCVKCTASLNIHMISPKVSRTKTGKLSIYIYCIYCNKGHKITIDSNFDMVLTATGYKHNIVLHWDKRDAVMKMALENILEKEPSLLSKELKK